MEIEKYKDAFKVVFADWKIHFDTKNRKVSFFTDEEENDLIDSREVFYRVPKHAKGKKKWEDMVNSAVLIYDKAKEYEVLS